MRRVSVVVAMAVLLLAPSAVWAQAGGIAGIVKDASGAVMPGVTVEAASPALIEKVRTVVTDEKGAYKIIDLRPGIYSVTFSLPGFATIKREGVELAAGFTAPVDAEMKIGSLEESVTVTGASPVVDVTNVKTQNNLTRAVLDIVPNSQTISSFSALTLGSVASGVTSGSDVGGNQGEQGMVSIHGALANDMKYAQDGMNTNNSMGTNGGIFKAGQNMNQLAVNEVQVTYNGGSADVETAGATFNFVTKDGGNRFSGSGRALYTNNDFQWKNLGPELVDRGARSAQSVKKVYDYGVAVGGPIKQDKVWFFTAHRTWGAHEYQPNAFYNKVQGTGRYEPDLDRPAYYISDARESGGRITWQMTLKDKLGVFTNYANTCSCIQGVSATVAPEATLNNIIPNSLTQATWTRVQTNRLLLEAGFTNLWTSFRFPHTAGDVDYTVSETDIPTTELSTGLVYNARAATSLAYTDFPEDFTDPAGQKNGRASVSYVTGTHAFKVGTSMQVGGLEVSGQVNSLPNFGPVAFRLLNGAPNTIVMYMSPQYQKQTFRNIGVYAQDQWTITSRITLNVGVRGDFFNGSYPDQEIPATPFVNGFHITGRDNVPAWKNVSPRIGAAYRVTGDGKTALKVSWGRYVGAAGAGFPQQVNPANSIVTTATRTWADANRNFFPDGNPRLPGANGELGPISNTAFGTPVPNTTFSDDILTANRPYTYQTSAVLERELFPGWGLSLGYFRVENKGYYATQNTAVTASNFTTYCVTAPSDARLPGGGGNRICGLYDVNPAQFGRVQNLTTNASAFGDYKDVFDGADIAVRARFGSGGMVQGGVSLGRSVVDTCFANERPDVLPAGQSATTPRIGGGFCDVTGSWWDAKGQIKLSGSYPLPAGFLVSGVYQNLPGTPILANAVFTNAQIAPSLGRNLAACGAAAVCNATVTIALIPNTSVFEDRVNQVDIRLARNFRFGRVRATPALDLYNLFNTSAILARNNTLGAAWGTPLRFMDGRLAKIGVQLEF
jgi:hypothetical protein